MKIKLTELEKKPKMEMTKPSHRDLQRDRAMLSYKRFEQNGYIVIFFNSRTKFETNENKSNKSCFSHVKTRLGDGYLNSV